MILPGIALALFGALIMLITPLQRVTAYRSQNRTHYGAALRKAYPLPRDDGEHDDLLTKL